VVVLLLVDVAIPSSSSHGWIAGLASPIHQVIPSGIPSLAAAVAVLAACYWLFRSPGGSPGGVKERAGVNCQEC
jgi:hypothetical protein